MEPPAPHEALEKADAFLAFNADLQQDIDNVICLPLQSFGRPLKQAALTLADLRVLADLAREAIPHIGENVPPVSSNPVLDRIRREHREQVYLDLTRTKDVPPPAGDS
jgi:hypothetical protein